MNVYFLVEGKCTEMLVYPAWLSFLAPSLTQVESCSDVCTNHFFLFSGEGYPNMLTHLESAIKDVNKHGSFDYFVVCLDVEESSPTTLETKIEKHLHDNQIVLNSRTQFVIVFQNKCIETWFLGNRAFYKCSPQDTVLRDYIAHYNVHDDDPEFMLKPSGFSGSIADFHTRYFKKICAERNCRYAKSNPGPVTCEVFLHEISLRYQDTRHLGSFGDFLELCERF